MFTNESTIPQVPSMLSGYNHLSQFINRDFIYGFEHASERENEIMVTSVAKNKTTILLNILMNLHRFSAAIAY